MIRDKQGVAGRQDNNNHPAKRDSQSSSSILCQQDKAIFRFFSLVYSSTSSLSLSLTLSLSLLSLLSLFSLLSFLWFLSLLILFYTPPPILHTLATTVSPRGSIIISHSFTISLNPPVSDAGRSLRLLNLCNGESSIPFLPCHLYRRLNISKSWK